MKRILVAMAVLVLGVIFPWACAENNTPTQVAPPALGGNPTNTPAGSITPTFTGTLPTMTPTSTWTPTGAITPPTATFTPTTAWTLAPTPAYDNNYGTSAAPNGVYYDASTSTLYVAEAESKAGTIVNALEQFNYTGAGVMSYTFMNNQIVVGQATPCAQYQPTPQVYTLTTVNFPIGIAVSSPFGLVGGSPGMLEMLDASSSGGATLYVENNYAFCPTFQDGGPFMDLTSSFGGAPFNNPKCLTADSAGHFYVADTGNGYIDEFDGGGALCTPLCSPAWLHRWNGSGTGFGPSITFKAPNSLACDSFNNIYIGDPGPYSVNGYTTSMVQVYTSGGTTLLGAFPLIPGCVVNGLTADPTTGDFFVSDANNGQVEQYRLIDLLGNAPAAWPPPAGTVYTQAGLRRAWGDPHSYHEFQPYTPSCLQFIGNYIIVGDSGNDFLNTFGPFTLPL